MTYLTPDDIAVRIQVSRTTAYRIARACIHVKAGRLIRISERAFLQYLASKTQWADSIDVQKTAATTANGRTGKPSSSGASRYARGTKPSQSNDSANANSVRLTEPRTAKKR